VSRPALPTHRGRVQRAVRLATHPRRLGAAVRRRLGSESPPERRAPARPAVPSRFSLLTAHVDLAGLGLEIGPSHRPLLPKARGYNVRTADHLDAPGLQAKYAGVRPTERIEDVDYVLAPGRLTASVPDRFDYIVASHVVEHTVCLVSFLQDCEALLRPGGVASFALPDKRYSFDRFRERSSLGRVVDVYRAAPTVHSEGSVLEHHLNLVRKGDQVAWHDGAPGSYCYPHSIEHAQWRASVAATGEYVDTHNWVFTPHYFRLLIEDLHRLGFIGLREQAFHDTVGPEFYVTLAADAPGPGLTREELVVLAARETTMTEAIVFAPDRPVHRPASRS
jgi:SAM-dependent methyltransferase